MSPLVQKWLALVKTRRGIIVTALAAFMAVSLASSGSEDAQSPPTRISAAVVAFCVAWPLFWFLAEGLRRYWERHTWPQTPAFARPHSSSGSRTMLREDRNAAFFSDRGGFLWRKRIWFVGTGCPPVEIHPEQFALFETHGHESPVEIAQHPPRTWWYFNENIFWENEGYSSQDVKALIVQRQREKERKLRHAHALMDMEEDPETIRQSLPKDVKDAVWRKYGGKCAECGRAYMLEYDHIIPLAMGGSNTVNNLQLLCADCNRKKGGRL